MRISDWSSDVCSSDLEMRDAVDLRRLVARAGADPDADRDGLDARHMLGHDPEAVAERRDRDLRPGHAAPSSAILSRRNSWTRRRSLGSTRSEEHTSELQSLMRISYAAFCLKKKNN